MTQQNIYSVQMVLDECYVSEVLGSGPLGTIYRITHPSYGNCVVKYFKDSIAKRKNFLRKFFEDMEKLAQIDNPQIAKVHQWKNEEHTFVIRDLVLGTSLEERFKLGTKFTVAEATQIVGNMLHGLLGGYANDIAHRNLKPSNVILLANETLRFVDLCLPPTEPQYIAPEQWHGQKSDICSDIYSIGIMYYRMLCGRYPFAKEHNLKQAHLTQTPTWEFSNVTPQKICEILQSMLAKSPAERPHNPGNLLEKLQIVCREAGISLKQEFLPPQENATAKTNRPLPATAPSKHGSTAMMATMKRQEIGIVSKEQIPQEHFEAKDTKLLEEPAAEEIHLTIDCLQNNLQESLKRLSYIEERSLRQGPFLPRIARFPKGFEQKIVEHLQQAFRRETWLLKESDTPEEMEIEIDIEQSYALKHFYYYEDQLQQALHDKILVDADVAADNPSDLAYNIATCDTFVDTREHEDLANANAYASEETIATQESSQQTAADADVANAETQVEQKAFVTMETLAEQELSADTNMHDQDLAEMDTIVEEEETSNAYLENVATINDITINTAKSSLPITDLTSSTQGVRTQTRRFRNPCLEVKIDFSHAYQTIGWVKFVQEHKLQKDKHFDFVESDANVRKAIIYLEKLVDKYQKEQENIARIKEFFESDYEITELDRGGMGVVLKLTAKNDPTILSLRPENHWARKRYAPYLRVVRDRHDMEITYAEIPKGQEFVVKVAFGGYEESLIQEARILVHVAEDPQVCHTIIGAVQQGRLFAQNDPSQDQAQIGYYLMLEYAPEGNTEQLYRRFPNGRISPTVAFAITYGMTQTLQRLQTIGIIHRDLKPHNILLDKNGVPKLSDFGLAISTKAESDKLTEERKRLLRIMDPQFLQISREYEQTANDLETLRAGAPDAQQAEEIAQLQDKLAELQAREEKRANELKGKYRLVSAEENAMRQQFAGSPFYAAPEQFNTEIVLTPKADVYQLGALMFTLLTGKRPVEGKSTMEVMSQVLYPVKPKVVDYVEESSPVLEELSNLIHRMMHLKPAERISADQIREELDRILFDHALELRKEPVYKEPADIHTDEAKRAQWERKVAFAGQLHAKCVEVIFSTMFQSQLPKLQKSVNKIVFQCPHCHKKLHVYQHMDGKKGKCPQCQNTILVKLAQ